VPVETTTTYCITEEYKEYEQARLTCAALTHLPIKTVVEGWLMMMENVPQNEKLTLFLDYFVEQWLKNQNVLI